VATAEFGPYRLESLLGLGAMGEVWRALDTRKDRYIALKVLGSGLDTDGRFIERFRDEAALVAKLNGPHIVPIHDYGEIDGRLYIEMPLIEGTDLAALIARGPLEPQRAIDLVMQTANALDTAHRAGLVHRDVKPPNILVGDSGGGKDFVYLIDFGIARATHDTRISQTNSLVGTPAYMAPERFEGLGDLRSDIYALGCVLYEALTGKPPFEADNVWKLMKAHHLLPPPRPSALDAGVSSRFDAVVADSMAKRPDDRYPSAGALACAARNALLDVDDPDSRSHVSSAASRQDPGPSAPQQSDVPGRSRRRWVIVGVLMAAALIVLGAILWPTGDKAPAGATKGEAQASGPVVASIPVGGEPSDVTVSPDGSRVYVTNLLSDSMSVIDTVSRTVVDTVLVPGASTVALMPDGRKAYVGTSFGLVALDLTTKVQRPISLAKGQGESVAVTPDGSRAYVATGDGRSIAVVDTARDEVIANVQLGRTAQDVAVSPDGTIVYAAVFDYTGGEPDRGNITIIDAASSMIAETITTPPYPGRDYADLSPDGSFLYSDGFSGAGEPSLEIIDTRSRGVVGYIPVGINNPIIGAFSKDGSFAYVTESSSPSLFVVNLTSRSIAKTFPLDAVPSGVTADPAGEFAYVISSGLPNISPGVSITEPGVVYVVRLA